MQADRKEFPRGVSTLVGEMTNRPELIPDARLARLASARGPASAEAYILLELREARSAGDDVSAFEINGRYTVRSVAR